ncbi:MAG: TfoX/Sxy family protein [Rhodocyclaceae bacterium]|nr:TfoX/Sxy family protein [Rhodocyclaceae bacterium]MBP7080577.1 TfoX/Sxy family protein [Rhodocyclaceae bacterium]
MSAPKSIADLPSLGPKSQAMLSGAGITSIARLRQLGSVRAYALVKETNPNASLNLLWALESALSGEPWQEVARVHRASLLLALETLTNTSGAATVAEK